MKNKFTQALLAIACIFAGLQSYGQTDVYTVTSGELIFQWADLSFTPEHIAATGDEQVANPLRFTAFFHLGQYVHMDFTDNFGLFSGLAVRNIGIISDERLNMGTTDSPDIRNFKIVRRTYTVGLPLALKFGSFDDHFYFFAGGEIELAFAFKEKYWESHSRSGAKTKEVTWFGDQTPTFMPSVFAGVQLPGGVNVKFKYYINDFLNHDFKNPNNKVSDLTRYESTQSVYISMSWQFKTREAKQKFEREGKMAGL